MQKRIMAFLLALLLTLSATPNRASAGTLSYAEAYALKLLETASPWALQSIHEATEKHLFSIHNVSSYTENISRMNFCSIAIRWLEYATGKGIQTILREKGLTLDTSAFDDLGYLSGTDAITDILAAYALGITNGIGARIFGPHYSIDRQQAATLVVRTLQVAGADVADCPQADFTDLPQAESWAVSAISFVRAHGIMNGTGAEPPRFSPKTLYTFEQAIATFNNIDRDALLPYPTAAQPTVYGISLGDTAAQVRTKLGEPDRRFPCTNGHMYVYHDETYNAFVTVAFAETTGKAVSIYTMGESSMDTNALLERGHAIIEYIDDNDRGRVYAREVVSPRELYTAGDSIDLSGHIFELTNAFRALHGRSILTWNNALAKSAEGHALDMFTNNYFSHAGLNGSNSLTRALAAGYHGSYSTVVGENICMGYFTAESAMDGWINSPGHRENLLLAEYAELGVGCLNGYNVQNFGRRY